MLMLIVGRTGIRIRAMGNAPTAAARKPLVLEISHTTTPRSNSASGWRPWWTKQTDTNQTGELVARNNPGAAIIRQLLSAFFNAYIGFQGVCRESPLRPVCDLREQRVKTSVHVNETKHIEQLPNWTIGESFF